MEYVPGKCKEIADMINKSCLDMPALDMEGDDLDSFRLEYNDVLQTIKNNIKEGV